MEDKKIGNKKQKLLFCITSILVLFRIQTIHKGDFS